MNSLNDIFCKFDDLFNTYYKIYFLGLEGEHNIEYSASYTPGQSVRQKLYFYSHGDYFIGDFLYFSDGANQNVDFDIYNIKDYSDWDNLAQPMKTEYPLEIKILKNDRCLYIQTTDDNNILEYSDSFHVFAPKSGLDNGLLKKVTLSEFVIMKNTVRLSCDIESLNCR